MLRINFAQKYMNGAVHIEKKMKITFLVLIALFALGNANCQSTSQKSMQEQNNPLLCDPENGMCEIPSNGKQSATNGTAHANQKSVKIVYFTDPICSSCWGIEPQLRKLKLEYGDDIEVEYRMGGLLPDWSYNSGGISKPSDVAHHWDEVSKYYDMPIDGDVWLEDPLPSSYPPSIAFKAAQLQNQEKALLFLREIREMVFLQKKNITKWEHLESAAKKVGLNIVQFKTDYEGLAKELFQEDLSLGRTWNVRGFPTLFFADTTGRIETVYGSKPYSAFENALIKVNPTAEKKNYDKSWQSLFSYYPTFTAREYAELSNIPRNECEKFLDELVSKGHLKKQQTKNGSLWTGY